MMLYRVGNSECDMCLCRVSRTFKVGPADISVLTGVGFFAISGSVLYLSCMGTILQNLYHKFEKCSQFEKCSLSE